MKMQTEINDKEVIVDFDVEGDPDGFNVFVTSITQVCDGVEIPDDPEYDLKFLCREYYANLQFETYMRTGECI